MQDETVLQAVRVEQSRVLVGDLANAALGVLRTAMTSEDVPWGVRVQAAKTVLDRAGHIAPKAAEPPRAGDKPLSEMTADELEAFIRRGREALDGAARPQLDLVAIAPPDAPGAPQVIDIIDEGAAPMTQSTASDPAPGSAG